MAVRPDYDIGVLNLTSSSANFTTSGSALQTAAVQAGDAIIAPSGHVLIIASITGQNSGTLFLPCPPAAAGTGLALRIRFQPDGSRYQGAVRNLIDLLSSGNVEALAALVGADGMVPIFTGPGTLDLADPATFGIQDPNGSLGKLAALTLEASKILNTDATGELTQSDLTGFARSMLDDPDGATVWATMGGVAETGRIVFPTGMVLMMGTLNSPPEGAGLAILPTAFPNNMIGVSASLTNPTGSNYARMITAYTYNRFAFNVATQAIFNGGALQYDGNIPFSFLAWGN